MIFSDEILREMIKNVESQKTDPLFDKRASPLKIDESQFSVFPKTTDDFMLTASIPYIEHVVIASEDKKSLKGKKRAIEVGDIIEEAHPDQVSVAEGPDGTGVVENLNEQHVKIVNILNKMPSGFNFNTFAKAVRALVKVADKLEDAGDYEGATRVDKTLVALMAARDNLKKNAAITPEGDLKKETLPSIFKAIDNLNSVSEAPNLNSGNQISPPIDLGESQARTQVAFPPRPAPLSRPVPEGLPKTPSVHAPAPTIHGFSPSGGPAAAPQGQGAGGGGGAPPPPAPAPQGGTTAPSRRPYTSPSINSGTLSGPPLSPGAVAPAAQGGGSGSGGSGGPAQGGPAARSPGRAGRALSFLGRHKGKAAILLAVVGATVGAHSAYKSFQHDWDKYVKIILDESQGNKDVSRFVEVMNKKREGVKAAIETKSLTEEKLKLLESLKIDAKTLVDFSPKISPKAEDAARGILKLTEELDATIADIARRQAVQVDGANQDSEEENKQGDMDPDRINGMKQFFKELSGDPLKMDGQMDSRLKEHIRSFVSEFRYDRRFAATSFPSNATALTEENIINRGNYQMLKRLDYIWTNPAAAVQAAKAGKAA